VELDLVERVLMALGLPSLPDAAGRQAIEAFNDRLLARAGGSRDRLPQLDEEALRRILSPCLTEARDLVHGLSGGPSTGAAGTPWVWADPALSLVAPFWDEVLGGQSAVVMVHCPPAVAQEAPTGNEPPDDLTTWDVYTRAALVQASERPSAIVQVESLSGEPKEIAELFAALVGYVGSDVSADQLAEAVGLLEQAEPASPAGSGRAPLVEGPIAVLSQLLDRLDGLHLSATWSIDRDLLDDMAGFYDESYYETACSGYGGIPYTWSEPHWVNFFGTIAEQIVETLHPRTVLDAGCAIGLLVTSLRRLGVDARGFDVSAWAIDQVPDEVRPFCTVASITDDIDGHYDLITCVEVVEHLPAFMAAQAVDNLCRHADAILLSTTSDDFAEPTHLNVRAGGYWASMFAKHGFVRDPDYDAGFLSPQAVLLRRSPTDADALLEAYERALENTSQRLRDRLDAAVAEHDRLADRYNELAGLRLAESLAAQRTMLERERSLQILSSSVETTRAELEAIRSSRWFRYGEVPRRAYGLLRRLRDARLRTLAPLTAPAPAPAPCGGSYDLWVDTYDTIDDDARRRIRARIDELDDGPLVSVVLPVFDTPPAYLRAAVDSVRSQFYPNWELCIADDNSTDPAVGAVLEDYAAGDDRIKILRRPENGHISAATNSAIGLARGEWVAFLDHDDTYAEHALAMMVLALADRPDAAMAYSDEDKIDAAGRRHDPYFKPDFDPLLLLGQNYLTHLLLVRRRLLEETGGLREGFEGSQDWDLVLRLSERLTPDQVVHVPHVLYHWRTHAASTASGIAGKPYAAGAGRRAVVEHLGRTGRAAQVSTVALSGHNRVSWPVPDPAPLVSIVIPTRDGKYLPRCVDSLLGLSTYPNFEIVVVDNGSQSYGTLNYLSARRGQVTVIRDERPFNYSALNNVAVARAAGELVCLLNDDTEVVGGGWLDEMVGHIIQPGVGAVGAKLCYDDGRVQHAGVHLGIGGVAGHTHKLADRLSPGYMGRLQVAQTLSAVTAACMLVRRQAWDQVGGLEEERLAVAFNDVDFCIRLGEAGWRIVWTPAAEMVHHESVSRGTEDSRQVEFAAEIHYMQATWGAKLRCDPAYNPNLTLVSEDWALAWPPRVPLP
jgi:GT2 family glycosyltransferase